jgi:hypothetical protein
MREASSMGKDQIPAPRQRETWPSDVTAVQWTLFETFVMLTIAALSSFLLAQGNGALGGCLLATAVSVRTALVDYSIIGEMANACVLLFGVPMLILAVLCAMQ